MPDNEKRQQSESRIIAKDSGRSLPVTNTATPMPKVKPPKQPEHQQQQK